MSDSDEKMFDAIHPYAGGALKSILLVNGGASIALLAFIGNIVTSNPKSLLISTLSLPLAYYTSGVLAAAAASAGAYITQYSYFHFGQKWGQFWHWTSAIVLIASYILFAIGSYLAYDTFRNGA